MAFSFGGASTPAPAPPGGGGFSFGATPASAAAPGAPAPAPAAAATGGFSFGGGGNGSSAASTTASSSTAPTANTAAAPAPVAGGFSFGGNSGSTGTPSPAAPATGGGFTLGGSAPTSAPGAPAPSGAPNSTGPAPATGGFSFGGSTAGALTTPGAPAPAAAAPGISSGGFSFGGAPAPTHAANSTAVVPTAGAGNSLSTTGANVNPNAVVVPEFESVFPHLQTLSTIRRLLKKISGSSSTQLQSDDDSVYAGQELLHMLQCDSSNNKDDEKAIIGRFLSNPKPIAFQARDDGFRQKIYANPNVMLHGKEAGLTMPLMKEILELSDDLRISELHAMALYAKASESDTRQWLERHLASISSSGEGKSESNKLGNNVAKAARELYFLEKSSGLTSLLLLLQHRLYENPTLLQATDQIINCNLVDNLVTLVQDYSQLENGLEQELAQKKANSAARTSMLGGPAQSQQQQSSHPEIESFGKILLNFAYQQKQLAATCLFYLTYHTQAKVDEVAAIIDLIQKLTNGTMGKDGLPMMDPFMDVPSVFEGQKQPTQQSHHQQQPWRTTPFTQALPPLVDKDPLQWQKEFVRSQWEDSGGKPQLLKCVSVLCMAVISSLNSQQILIDRNMHGPNKFGQGNAILPPLSGSTPDGVTPPEASQLGPIHSRLDPTLDPQNSWKRKDIWGLLAASYALLLRPAAKAVASPRLGSTLPSSSGIIDIKKTWRACLEIPTEVKSFTFARLSLVPSFSRHSSVGPDRNCNEYEFYMSVLSEFTSQYLQVLCESGDVPISRAKWKNDEETELIIQKNEQERLKQFSSWSGTDTTAEDESTRIPESVDLLRRPDLMDDVMALAVTVCSAGPEYANNFWAVEVEEVESTNDGTFKVCRKLAKSTALTTLERIQRKDTSLLPAYVSFLAALALAEDPESSNNGGAATVHRILSEPSDGAGKLTWPSLISVIRWFVRQMSASEYDNNSSKTVSSTDTLRSTTGTSGTEPTAYYYGGDRRTATSSSTSTSFQGGHSSTATTSTSADSTKPKELGDANTMILLSYLNVISSVASNCREARSAIVSIALPLEDSAGEDPVLTILFSLAMCPLSPQLRGCVFVAISSLLRTDAPSKDEKDWARKAWGLLEESQTLPIAMLYQFGQSPQAAAHVSDGGLRFPPSSTGQVGTGTEGQYATPWMPPDAKLGIIYEMEQVESRMGFYPSTEGLLHLLTTLFSVGGCPSDLGRYWRPRSGCSPYIEYVVHFVLPRAIGFEKRDGGLPFRTLADKSRLVSLALEVVHAVISRYSVPDSANYHQSVPALTDERKPGRSQEQTPTEVFGLSAVDSTTFVTPDVLEVKDFERDYRDISVETMHSTFGLSVEDSTSLSLMNDREVFFDASSNVQSNAVTGEASFPAPKSPGFTILTDIFSTTGGKLFQSLVLVMTDHSASSGIYAGYGLPEYKAAIADALFGETAPNFLITKAYESKKKNISVTKASLLQPPFPSGWQTAYDSEKGKGHCGSADGVFWRERSVLLSLRILCAAAAREEKFVHAVNSISVPLKIAPVIRFQKLGALASGIEASNVQVSRLTNLMAASSGIVVSGKRRVEAVPTIVEYIAYEALSIGVDKELASSAMALFVYINRSLPMQDSLRLLCSDSIDGAKSFAASISQRLDASSKRAHLLAHYEMVDLILDLILRDLRSGSTREINLSHVLLGFPVGSSGDEWEPTNIKGTGDCLSLILDLLSDEGFVRQEKTLAFASKCYELIYRLTTTKNIDRTLNAQRVLYVAGKLRLLSFWRHHLLRFLGHRQGMPSMLETISSSTYVQEGSDHLLHCVAWLLRGVANELRMLMGLPVHGLSRNHPLAVLASPQYSKCRDLLSLLYGGSFKLAINALECLPLAKKQIITETTVPPSAVVKASVSPLKGSSEVTQGWSIVCLDKLVQQMFLHHGKGHTVTVENALKWAKQWNQAVAWECAVSHLTESFRVFTSSSFVYCKAALLDDGCSMNAMSSGAAPLDTRGVVQLISLMLLQMAPPRQKRPSAICMDDAFYSSTTLSLSYTVFGVVEELMAILKSLKVPVAEGDALRISELVARAIVTSANAGGICQSSQQRERTAVLGSALALVMQFVCDNDKSDSGLVSSGPERVTLLRAAMVLSKLACNPVNGLSASDQASEQFAAVALTSRSALSALFRGIDDDASTRKESFIAQTFDGHADTLASFAQLVRTLDNNICLLLEQISMRRFGTEILQDAGVLRALVDAADNYSKEESRVKQGFHVPVSSMQSYGSTKIGIPTFFSGHLSLLNSMLATGDISSDRRARIAENSALFLQHNTGVINRLLSEFPTDGDVTKELMRCLYLTLESLSEGDKPDGRPALGSSDYGAPGRLLRDSTYASLEHRALELCYHLSQYPFPQRLLPSLPPNLNSKQYTGDLERPVVSVTTTEQRTWWDMVEGNPHPMQKEMAFPPTGPSDLGGWQTGSSSDDIALRWSDFKYELSIDSAEILEACLLYLNQRVIVSPSVTLDWLALAKGFCRCADAARAMEGRLRNYSSPDDLVNSMLHAGIGDLNQKENSTQSARMEKQYLSILGPLLGRCAEKILFLAVRHSRLLSREKLSEKTRKSIIDLSTAMLATLDHTRVEYMGLGCVGMAEDEEKRDGTKKVASVLRKVLESQLKQFEPEYERYY